MGKIMNQKPTIKAIIGLGNKGHQYEKTRHNIGFLVVNQLARDYYGSWSAKDLLELATITLNDKPVLLIKPQTYMNSSGKVIPFLQKKGIKPEEILVVHDELEKPFGSLATRLGGSHRGHNGLRSIIEHAGPDFWRLRFGIGRPEDKAQVADYVLMNFSEPKEKIEQLIHESVSLIVKEFF